MKEKSSHIVFILFIYILITNQTFAMFKQRGYTQPQPVQERKPNSVPQNIKPTTDRFEISYSHDYLDHKNTYGTWDTINMTNYQHIADGLTVFYQAELHRRKSGDAILGSVGAYKDWSDYFYTYTQVTAGSKSEYLPKFRIDNDFNFKFGEKKNIVTVLGLTYINAHDVHRDKIISAGLMYYAPKYNISYRFFRNLSNPGNVISYSHTLSIGYGQEKLQWLYLDLSLGNPAYLAIDVSLLEEVHQNSSEAKISYRKWLTNSTGFYGSVGYFKLSDGYDKYHFNVGYFIEY